MRELTELKRSGSLVDALLADHGLFHLKADLRWIELTSARLGALAETVRRYGGNILELESTTESAPMSGEPLFSLRMSVRLEAPGAEAELWRELEAVAAAQGIDLELHAAPVADGDSVLHGPERRARSRDPG